MRNIFTVTTANSSPLLTTSEARSALGITDGSRDADLVRAVARISASIFRVCKVKTDGIHAPTLLSESVTDVFRLDCPLHSPLFLSRRRVTEIETVSEGDTELDEDTFEVEPASGLLSLVTEPSCWPRGKITVEYIAGFTVVPDDLKLAAETWLREIWRDSLESPGDSSDPFLKSVDIPGVLSESRWVDPSTAEILPQEVRGILVDGGYIETWVA